MFRLLGILLGSAIATGMLILLVGIPQIGEDVAPGPVAVQLPLEAEPVAQAELIIEETTPAAQDVEPLRSVAPEPLPDPEPDPAPEPEPVAATTMAPDAPSTPVVMPDIPEQRWYAFWSPFRSRIAADGFVTQLQRVTGLDYRVVNVKPGVYEVVFAYNTDEEIPVHLSQISAATGLDMPEG